MQIERRDFLKVLSAGAITAAGVKPSFGKDMPSKERPPDAPAILYDATLCIGCKTCEVGCKKANNLPVDQSDIEKMYEVNGIWDSADDLSTDSFLKIKLYKDGQGTLKDSEKDGFSFMRSACMHCTDPDCQSVCPASALIKDAKTGIVNWNPDACIGCRYCQMACPFGIPKFEYDEALTPRIRKCFMCSHQLAEKNITGCAEACPTGATLFGKFEDILKEAKRRTVLKEGENYSYPVHTLDGKFKASRPAAKYINYVYGEKDGGGTQIIVLSAVSFQKLGLPKLPEYSSGSKSEGLQHALYQGLIGPLVVFGGLLFAAFRSVKNEQKEE